MGTGQGRTRLRTIGWDSDGPTGHQNPHEVFVIMLCNCHIFRNAVYVQFSKMSFFSRLYLRFAHHSSFPGSVEIVQLLARLRVWHLQGGSFILSFLRNGYNRLDMSHLILTNFLDRLGEAANTHQRPGPRYAVNKLYTFIFNLINRDMGI